jgi:hypothetical protein
MIVLQAKDTSCLIRNPPITLNWLIIIISNMIITIMYFPNIIMCYPN